MRRRTNSRWATTPWPVTEEKPTPSLNLADALLIECRGQSFTVGEVALMVALLGTSTIETVPGECQVVLAKCRAAVAAADKDKTQGL